MIEFPQFIYGEVIDPGVCDDIIEWFESNNGTDNHVKGRVGPEDDKNVKPSVKDSTDSSLVLNDELLKDYWGQLDLVCENYRTVYPLSERFQLPWRDIEFPNVQRYYPGQGFKKYHCEAGGADRRHLVYMTYLNDVPDGGTHFLHQDFYCPAIKGLTIIWPAPWTFAHKGVISHTTTKYIVTGWYNFYGEKS